jgi:hypothetical protein
MDSSCGRSIYGFHSREKRGPPNLLAVPGKFKKLLASCHYYGVWTRTQSVKIALKSRWETIFPWGESSQLVNHNHQKINGLIRKCRFNPVAMLVETGYQGRQPKLDTVNVTQTINNFVSCENSVFFLDLMKLCGTIDNGRLEVTY